MNYVQGKYFNIFYNDMELYASRIGDPCASPRLAFGIPTIVTHKNVGLLSTLLSHEEKVCGSLTFKYQLWPFPFAYGTLIDLGVARYEFRFIHEGQQYCVLSVTDLGRDILDNTPIPFLVHNLIRCSTDFSDDPDTDWVKSDYLALQEAIEFFMRKLSKADLPEFLTHEYSETRESAKEVLDAFL